MRRLEFLNRLDKFNVKIVILLACILDLKEYLTSSKHFYPSKNMNTKFSGHFFSFGTMLQDVQCRTMCKHLALNNTRLWLHVSNQFISFQT